MNSREELSEELMMESTCTSEVTRIGWMTDGVYSDDKRSAATAYKFVWASNASRALIPTKIT